KTASSLAILLLAVGASPARAADCLQQIDSLYVEYDLPATEAMAGTQTSVYGEAAPPSDTPQLPAGGFSASPPGRPNLHSSTGRGGSRGSLAGIPALPQHNNLSAEQRRRLADKLHEARAVEAQGDEDKCFAVLHEAQAIAGKHG
ncbi:MAG: hypothetical protein JO010_01720, partial [Alphaproteobacteria bacterium]|nr:hypothetical protein [Alphaproteobacteria bacterium]